MNDTTGTSGTEPSRAAMVATIRALADFIESRTDLPVPHSVRAQHSILKSRVPDYEDRLEMLRNFADAAGAQATLRKWGAFVVYLGDGPWQAEYVVHAEPERAR